MINVPRGVGLYCFKNSLGEWCPYAMVPAGPVPFNRSTGWEWCCITEGRILFKQIGARKFKERAA